MPFQPKPGQQITIDDTPYTIAEHPYAPGFPYGQEGRAATVYKLVAEDGYGQALKVFKSTYRVPSLAGQATALAPIAELPALRVCDRTVLSALRHQQLLQAYPELLYAVLMPWIEGPTWFDIVMDRREMSPEQSLGMARGLLKALVTMEERGIAHCDLSGPNLILPGLLDKAFGNGTQPVELVDVEQLYGADLKRPERLTMGTSGYTHKSPDHLWSREADRFAGAILVAELLGWCVPEVRAAAWESSYFNQAEMQTECERYRLLSRTLSSRWGQSVTELLDRVWFSETLAECPNFAEWMLSLPDEIIVEDPIPKDTTCSATLYSLARELEQQDNYAGAITTYQHLKGILQHQTNSVASLDATMRRLDAQIAEEASAPAVAAVEPEADPLAELFDDGLSAYQRDRWREAKELLGEVVRQQPDYAHAGWEAHKLLEEAQRQSRPLWVRMLQYGGRILVSAVLVILIVVGTFTGAYVTLIRPIVTASLFTFTRPLLHELTYISGGGGCWTVTEQEINRGLADRVPTLVDDNEMKVRITENAIRASMNIADQAIWLEMYPPAGQQVQDFALERVELSNGLKVLFSPEDLAEFTNEYVREEILGSEGMKTLSLSLYPNEGQVVVCARKWSSP